MSENKEPLRKKFAKKARRGFTDVAICLTTGAAVLGGAGYGTWVGMSELASEPWDFATPEIRNQEVKNLEAEFSRLNDLDQSFDDIKVQREAAFVSRSNGDFERLTTEMMKTEEQLKTDVSAYTESILWNRDIHEQDYQMFGDQLKNSDLVDYSKIIPETSRREAANLQECRLDPGNDSARDINNCMNSEVDEEAEAISVVLVSIPLFIAMLFMGSEGRLNPVPEKWERLPNNPNRGGSGSARPGALNRIREKIPGLRPKRPGN